MCDCVTEAVLVLYVRVGESCARKEHGFFLTGEVMYTVPGDAYHLQQ